MAFPYGTVGLEIANDFLWDVAGPVALLQAKMLIFVSVLWGLILLVRSLGFDVFLSDQAGRLSRRIRPFIGVWLVLIRTDRTLFHPWYLGSVFRLLLPNLLTLSVGHVPGHSPRLE